MKSATLDAAANGLNSIVLGAPFSPSQTEPPPKPLFDECYLTRLRSGDEETAEHFNCYFRRLLRGWLWGKFTREQEEELIDHAMAIAFDRIKRGQPKDAARLCAYVTGICVNLARLAMRPSFNYGNGSGLESMPLRDSAENAEQRLLARERALEVRKVLRSLGKRDRGILVDLFFHEKKRNEVCARYGVNREMLRLILFRARRRFQNGWAGRS